MLGSFGSMRNVENGDREKTRLKNYDSVSMYLDPPTEDISIDEFELFALDRLMVLKKIDELKSKGFKGTELKDNVNKALEKYMNVNSFGATLQDSLRKDVLSHFILRLAFCRSEDYRRWFLSQECALFRHRLESLPSSTLIGLMKSYELNYELVSTEEKEEKKSRLKTVAGKTVADFESCTFFKVQFTDAIDLVGSRQVYLERGVAYVPSHRVVTVIVSYFRMSLSKSLTVAYAAFPSISNDFRLGPLLTSMSNNFSASLNQISFGENGDVSPKDLDFLSKQSMPLCMYNLHISLRREHKVKHTGRLQYGMFLKGIGLSLENALSFWQNEFTQKMTQEQFNKQYAYNVRHMYGKEGKRTNYTPYSCTKIIMGASPGVGEHHGCPYRHSDFNHISSLLKNLNINEETRNEICESAKSKNYQSACKTHFLAVHRGVENMDIELDGVAMHPNSWFSCSKLYYSKKNVNNKKEQGTSDSLTSKGL